MNECNHEDCFTCPYSDCILPDIKLTPRAVLKVRKRYYKKHREELLEKQKQYYTKNKETRLAYQSEYAKRDYVREKRRAYNAEYRAKHREELNAKNLAKYYAKKEGKQCEVEQRGEH